MQVRDFGTSCFDLAGNLGSKHADPHILIVEDELVTRNVKVFSKQKVMMCVEATDGAEMHQILSENDINSVIHGYQPAGKMVSC